MPFFRYPSRRREVPLRLIVPNLLTTIALCCGLASVHFSLRADWNRALVAVFIAAVFDLLDGRAARLLKASSPFGTMLDSLSDFLAFGIAPAVLLHQWTLANPEIRGMRDRDADVLALASMMTFVLCSGLRLARFTAATRQVRSSNSPPPPEPRPSPLAQKFFTGLPTPAAAAAVLIPPMLETSSRVNYRVPDGIVIVYTFVIAILMIGRQPMFSLKKIRIPRRFVAPLLVAVGLIVVFFTKYPWIIICIFAGGYLLSAPFSYMAYKRAVRQLRAADVPAVA
jgi:CDP-diacylglycerol---serine O-phosphatidyltransferase